jgi:hypothetical protein
MYRKLKISSMSLADAVTVAFFFFRWAINSTHE